MSARTLRSIVTAVVFALVPFFAVARADVSLAWPRGTRRRVGPCGRFRRMETGDGSPNPQFHGIGDRAARVGIHLQQVSGENPAMVKLIASAEGLKSDQIEIKLK